MFAETVNSLVDGMQKRQRDYSVSVIDIPSRDEARVESSRLGTLVKSYGLTQGDKHKVPRHVFLGTEAMQRGFLQALFTADGTVVGGPKKGLSVRLSQSDEQLLQQVQQLLLNFGIACKIYCNRRQAGYRLLPDGKGGLKDYWCKAQHELVIGKVNLYKFQKDIGFLRKDKQARLDEGLMSYGERGPYRENFTTSFKSLTEEGVENVYDLIEPYSHSFVANGIVVHNCGEQALGPNEACNLGSINLFEFISEDATNLDWGSLRETVRTAVHFLDNVIDVNPYPMPDIVKAAKDNRRIGLGVMGWAEVLFSLELHYDSEQAVSFAESVMVFINRAAHDKSSEIAETRGSFPNWEHSIYKDVGPMRNSTLTSIAPTGSISIIAGTSSGIEPIFALAYRHIVKQPEGDERVLTFINPIFERVAKERGFWSEALKSKVLASGSVHDLEEVPADIRRIFVTAHEIEPYWHVRTQAAFQKHTDNGVSKTINLPVHATCKDIEDAYLLAYETGCLGITVFRDGCKDTQVLHIGTQEDAHVLHIGTEKNVVIGTQEETVPQSFSKTSKVRPIRLDGRTYRKKTPVGTAYITVNANGGGDQEPFEVFINVGKAGSDVAADAEGLGRLISLILRLPCSLSAYERAQDIVSQLRGIGSGRAQGFGKQRVMSLADAVAQALAEHVGFNATSQLPGLPDVDEDTQQRTGDMCPECGQATLIFEEGCKKCYFCGYSEC